MQPSVLGSYIRRKNQFVSCEPAPVTETELPMTKTDAAKRVAVIGAGPAGLATAMTAAQVGHDVTLFDQADKIGGN